MRDIIVIVPGIVLCASTCGGSLSMTNIQNVSMVASSEDARAAVGKAVRIRGTVQREKLGDTINVGDLSVRCEDVRFPDDIVGHIATAEGTLVVVRDEPATTSTRGEINQGTGLGGSSFVIRHCVVR